MSSLRVGLRRVELGLRGRTPGTAGLQAAACAAAVLMVLTGCAGAPLRPANRPIAIALQDPATTRLGKKFLELSRTKEGYSGFHLIESGIDGFATRLQMARSAERTLDVQYFIFRGDATGTAFTEELRHAADRGVRVRVLVDDGDTQAGDEHILRLDGYPNIEVRVFNPFDWRTHNPVVRNIDFLIHKARLDYRMHNKVMVADNAVALGGGRNVGNQYFQVDPRSQFADADIFVAGPLVQTISASFDQFWNSDMVVAARDLGATAKPYAVPLAVPRILGSGVDYLAYADAGEPYEHLIREPESLIWAPAALVYDSPDKKAVEEREQPGRLMSRSVEEEMRTARNELLMVTPYFAPSPGEFNLLEQVRAKGAQVKILTNSLESGTSVAAQSGYAKVRLPLAQSGVQFFEIRSRLESTRGSGQTAMISRFGHYGLHAKLYVFDRSRCFVGSWNFDERSLHINTEIGFVIDSTAIAEQLAERIEAMTSLEAAYRVGVAGTAAKPRLTWESERDHEQVSLSREPSRGWWRQLGEKMLALLPLQPEL